MTFVSLINGYLEMFST